MRFLILTQYYPPEVGAAQVRLAAIARELSGAGHEVEVVTALPNYPSGKLNTSDRGVLRRRETSDGIRVSRMWLYPAAGAGVKRLASYLSFTMSGLLGGLAARRPDVIFVESPPLFLGLTGWVLARRFNARLILNVSDLWPDSIRDIGVMQHGPWLGIAERLEEWLYRHATAVTAVTEGIRHRLVTTKGVPPERVLFLPNGVDTEILHVVEADAADGRSAPTFVYTGNHGYAQGLDIILDAALSAPDLDFVLVGDGSDKERLQAEATKRRLRNVRFEAPVPQHAIAHIYALSTAGIASLRRSDLMEGARPAKTLAIMACGRPVLYAGSGEGADLVRSADAGIVVEPGDGDALAEAARAIAANPMRAAEMGRNGRDYVQRHSKWSVLVANWIDDFERVRPNLGTP